MADNSSVPVASGNETFANKDIAGVKYPRHIPTDSTGAEIVPAKAAQLPAALGAGGGIKVDGSGTALPVSGAFYQATQPVSLASVPSHAVTNAGTFATQAAVVPGASETKVTAATIGTGGVGYLGWLSTIANYLAGTLTVATHAVTQSGSWVIAAGSALIGKVGIDQTTDGTTNKVAADVRLGGVAAATGLGVAGATVQRVVLASDSAGITAPGQTTMSASMPVTMASDQGAIKTNAVASAAANGTTLSRINAAATTNTTPVKTSAGQIYSLSVYNVASYTVFLKLFNKASAPTLGTDTPIWTIPVPAGGGFSKVWPMGIPFATGISYAITKLQADSDTTVVVAGDATGQIMWI